MKNDVTVTLLVLVFEQQCDSIICIHLICNLWPKHVNHIIHSNNYLICFSLTAQSQAISVLLILK